MSDVHPYLTPEAQARDNIDQMRANAGWIT